MVFFRSLSHFLSLAAFLLSPATVLVTNEELLMKLLIVEPATAFLVRLRSRSKDAEQPLVAPDRGRELEPV